MADLSAMNEGFMALALILFLAFMGLFMFVRYRRCKRDIQQFEFILQKLSQPAFLLDASHTIVFAHMGQSVGGAQISKAHDMFTGRFFLEVMESFEVADLNAVKEALVHAQKYCQRLVGAFPVKRYALNFVPLSPLFEPLRTLVLFEEIMGQEFAIRSFSLFLTNIGHELRTPLNAIVGFSELLTREIQGRMDHMKCEHYIQHIHKSSQNLHETLLQLIDLAHLSIGDMPLQESVIDLRLFLEHILDQLHSLGEIPTSMYPPLSLWKARIDMDKLEKAIVSTLRDVHHIIGSTEPIEGRLERGKYGQVTLQFICHGSTSFEPNFLHAIQAPLLIRDAKVPRTHYALNFIIGCALANLHEGHIELESQKVDHEGRYRVVIGLVLPSKRIVSSQL